jgi:hypothetical protein
METSMSIPKEHRQQFLKAQRQQDLFPEQSQPVQRTAWNFPLPGIESVSV